MRMSRLLGLVAVLIFVFGLMPLTALADGPIHTVQPGETLASIAAQYGTSATALKRANGITDANLIRPGQQLSIPSSAGASSAPTAPAGPSKATPVPVTTTGLRYTVVPGDTLGNIAARFRVNSSTLLRVNGLANANVLRSGMVLTIPGASNSAEPAAQSSSTSTAGAQPAKPAPVASTPRKGSYNQFGGGPQNYLDPTRFAVSISMQHCWLLQDNNVVGSWPCSTGRKHYETPPGFYTIQSKMPSVFARTWNFYLPYWLGIYNIGGLENGIHGLPYNKWGNDWGDEIGSPISFGCIVLQDEAARKLYEVAYIGMQVMILN